MKSKQTKKRLGVVAVMLLLVIAIGATAGTTLAKYITSATVDSQTAAVAKWGYTITTNANDLFSKQYDQGKIVEANNDTIDVKSSGSYNVVAPGTSSEGTTDGKLVVTIDGSAEVAAQLVINVKEFDTIWLNYKTSEDGEDGREMYYPLQWTLTATADSTTETKEVDLAGAEGDTYAEKLANQIALGLEYGTTLPEGATVSTDGSKVLVDLPMGTEFDSFKLTIAWKWEFEDSKDVQDTILGALAEIGDGEVKGTLNTSADDGATITTVDLSDYAAKDDGTTYYNLDVKISLSISVVQVQTTPTVAP